MKTNTQLDQDILDITMKIQSDYPELVKYMEEMPVKVSGKDKQDLEEYYNSLKTLLNDYIEAHKPVENKKIVHFKPLDYSSSEDIY
jgi:hypothetical protein